MSVSSSYLEAAIGMGAAAREKGDVEVLVNMSQMTVSQMSLRNMTDSRQQRQHWLAEQAFRFLERIWAVSRLTLCFMFPTTRI